MERIGHNVYRSIDIPLTDEECNRFNQFGVFELRLEVKKMFGSDRRYIGCEYIREEKSLYIVGTKDYIAELEGAL